MHKLTLLPRDPEFLDKWQDGPSKHRRYILIIKKKAFRSFHRTKKEKINLNSTSNEWKWKGGMGKALAEKNVPNHNKSFRGTKNGGKWQPACSKNWYWFDRERSI